MNSNLGNECITPAAAGNVLTAIEESKEMGIAEAIDNVFSIGDVSGT